MLAGFPSWENGLPDRSRGAGVDAGREAAAGLGAAGEAVCWDPEAVPLAVVEVVALGAVVEAPEPSRLVRRTFRLLSSELSSLSRFSFPSRAPSIAFGMPSFKPRTSSLMRLVSSSRLREEDLSSRTTSSTSRRAVSSRVVRASSAALRVAVSAES